MAHHRKSSQQAAVVFAFQQDRSGGEWQSDRHSAQAAEGKMPDEFVNTAGVMGLVCV